MKKIIFYTILCTLFLFTAQGQNLEANILDNIEGGNLVYSEHTGKAYVLFSDTFDESQNSIGVINTASEDFESYLEIGPNPKVLALDSSGQYLYVGLRGNGFITKVDLNTLTIIQSFSAGFNDQNEALFPQDITVDPNNHNRIVVALEESNYSEGVAVYENGIRTTNISNESHPTNSICFVNSDSEYVWAFNNQHSGFELARYDFGSNSIHHDNEWSGLINGYNTIIKSYGDRIYSSNGTALQIPLDDNDDPILLNQFTDNDYYRARMTYDPFENLLVYVFEGSEVTLRRFDANTFNFVDELEMPDLSDDAISLACYAANSYVFSTEDGELVFVRPSTTLSIENNNQEVIGIFPNPTVDYFSVDGVRDIKNIFVYNMIGQKVQTFNKQERYDISSLSNGNYIVQIESGTAVVSKQILKR